MTPAQYILHSINPFRRTPCRKILFSAGELSDTPNCDAQAQTGRTQRSRVGTSGMTGATDLFNRTSRGQIQTGSGCGQGYKNAGLCCGFGRKNTGRSGARTHLEESHKLEETRRCGTRGEEVRHRLRGGGGCKDNSVGKWRRQERQNKTGTELKWTEKKFKPGRRPLWPRPSAAECS